MRLIAKEKGMEMIKVLGVPLKNCIGSLIKLGAIMGLIAGIIASKNIL